MEENKKVKKTRKRNIVFFSIWIISLIAVINMLSNASEYTSNKIIEQAKKSIPLTCNVTNNNSLSCEFEDKYTLLLSSSEYEEFERLKNNFISLAVSDKKENQCRALIAMEGLDMFLPIKYHMPETYDIVYVCQTGVYLNLVDLAKNKISKNNLKEVMCVLNEPKAGFVLNEGNILSVPKEEYITCEGRNEPFFTRDTLLKTKFVEECVPKLIMDSDKPEKRCEAIFDLVKEKTWKEKN